jgi:hypothetical protein
VNWTLSGLTEDLRSEFADFFEKVRQEGAQSGFRDLVSPVDPFNRVDLLTPLVTIAGVIGMLVLSGVAISAFATTLLALFVLYLLLTEVFGYQLSFVIPAAQ